MLQPFLQHYFRIIRFLDGLKRERKTLTALILLDIILAVASTIIDWSWLMQVPRHLIFFAPICSLYPLLLVIWLGLYAFQKKIPAWFTAFLFMGLISYGIMSFIYFPAYMAWEARGVNFHDVASIFWVAAYASQASVIASEMRRLPTYQYVLIFSYFFFKDYCDRYLGTFLDINIKNYPENLKLLSFGSIVTLHILAAGLILFLTLKIRKKEGIWKTGSQNRASENAF